MTYFLVGFVIALVGTSALLTAGALWSGYLLVVNWRDREWFFLERDVDGRYVLIRGIRLPGVVLRFARACWTAALGRVPREFSRRVPRGRRFAALHAHGSRTHAAHV